MLYYDRIDISERIDPTKINESRECMIFKYFFFNHWFKFQDYVCNIFYLFIHLFNVGKARYTIQAYRKNLLSL